MKKAGKSIWKDAGILIPLAIILVFVFLAIMAPIITGYEYDGIETANRLAGPSWAHIFGTDELGRDLFTRMLYGSRISVVIGISVPVISTALGTLLGMAAGYGGKIEEGIIMRIADVFFAFPSVLLILLIVFVMGRGIGNIILAIVLISFPQAVRMAYTETLKIRCTGYVEAAEAMGAGRTSIMFRHLLPNIRKVMIVVCINMIPFAILMESTISFLGLGIEKPVASWGTIINTGRQYLFSNPGLCLIPCAAIALFSISFYILGRKIDKTYV